jgi:hypothetical protein
VDNFRWCVGGLAGLCGPVARLNRSYQNYMAWFLLVGMIFACVQLAQLLLEFRAGMVIAISKVRTISF